MHSALVIGQDGTIGAALFQHLAKAGMRVAGTTRRDKPGAIRLDLSEPPEHWPQLPTMDVAYICVAIGRLDPCEQDPASTRLINVDRTVALIKRLQAAGMFVVFISSNQVFDGLQPLRKADDSPSPANEYGRQKAMTEKAISHIPRVATLRIAKVISQPFPLFDQWKKALLSGETIRGFTDLYTAPLPIASIVEALVFLGEKKQAGMYQISGPRDVSYHTLALAMADELGCDKNLVQKGSAVDSGISPKFLARYTTLNNTGLDHIAIPDAEALVRRYAKETP